MKKRSIDIFFTWCASPVGTVVIRGTRQHVTEMLFTEEAPEENDNPNDVINEAKRQLEEYFARQRNTFDLPLLPEGTEFQHTVWKLLQNIPFGRTTSYAALARQYGDIKAIRAVGSANGKNPIGIVIPCHRVIGSDGELVGYAGGLWRKKWLLEFESQHRQQSLF